MHSEDSMKPEPEQHHDVYTILEINTDVLRKDLNKLETETVRNRDAIHELRNGMHNNCNVLRENHADLKQIVQNNSVQISTIIERYEKIEKVVTNNTEVMQELRVGIKLGVWIIGSVGGFAGLFGFINELALLLK